MDITRLALVLAILVIVYLIVDRTRANAAEQEEKPEQQQQPQPIRVVYTTPSFFPGHPYLYGGPRWRRHRRFRRRLP